MILEFMCDSFAMSYIDENSGQHQKTNSAIQKATINEHLYSLNSENIEENKAPYYIGSPE